MLYYRLILQQSLSICMATYALVIFYNICVQDKLSGAMYFLSGANSCHVIDCLYILNTIAMLVSEHKIMISIDN